MRVNLFMAMSLNGIIADEQGKEDFLSLTNWQCFCKEAKKFGGFVIGRKTYELVTQHYEGYGFDDLGGVKIIISSDVGYQAPQGYTHAVSPQDSIKKAEAAGLRMLLLTGGPTLNSHFLNEKLVHEVWINIEPVLVGQGKNLVTPLLKECRLKYNECLALSDGILQIRYFVDDEKSHYG